ncbi:hypothetical protein BDW22DRAFT_1404101 [Trametopsis cervina]|nr:hypothetical protein BDW22DRAFT_1404101 [Trametopsis cervina]
MQPVDFTPEDQARLPSFKKHKFGFLHKKHSQHDLNQDKQSRGVPSADPIDEGERISSESAVSDIPFVRLDSGLLYSATLEDEFEKDVYRWAVLYENQRGVMFFSTPYYSRLSLLPIDPPAFTVPSTDKQTRRHHPSVSLASYPLPDGEWRWVSRTWMVDMRDNGQTQHDGFEYNWLFRQKHWQPQVGFFSAGGWVRRRRWVRLMMRPARSRITSPGGTSTLAIPGVSEEVLQLQHTEAGATRPPSIMPTLDAEEEQEEEEEEANVWKGDPDHDWDRCHHALMRLDRDGRRLELWQRWLRPPEEGDRTRSRRKATALPQKQWSEDEQPLPSQHARFTTTTVDGMLATDTGFNTDPAPREHVAHVLRDHGPKILDLFIYPDTRTRFIALVADAGLLTDLRTGFGPSTSMFEFYSSSQSLQNGLGGSGS